MKKLLHLLILALALVFIVLWLIENPGEVRFVWLGYEVTTSMAFLIACLSALYLVLYLLKLPVFFLQKLHLSLEKKRIVARENLIFKILNAYLSEDTQAEKKLLKSVDKTFAEQKSHTLLLKQLIHPTEETATELSLLEETALTGAKGLIEAKETQNDYLGALDIALKSVQKHPDTLWLKQTVFELQVQLNRWDEALVTLDELKSKRALDKKTYLMKKAALLLKLQRFKEAFETAPFSTEAALCYAKENPAKAASILKKSWKKNPAWETYKAYTELLDKEKPLSAYKKAEQFIVSAPANRLTHLALADAALNAHLWGQAGKELDIYLDAYPANIPAAEMKIYLEKEANNNPAAVEEWQTRLQKMGPYLPYTCSVCGHKSRKWECVCPACQALGTLN